jgi:hypothetical protein
MGCWRCGLILFCAVAAALGGRPASAHASRFRRLAESTIAFSSDGSRYAAWQVSAGSPVVVFDTRTGHRGEIVLPAGCELYDHVAPVQPTPASAGRFLVQCGSASGLLNVRTRTVTVLPEPRGPFGAGWNAVGTRYVEGTADQSACRQSRSERARAWCIALYDIATGSVSYRPGSQLGDLDRPGAPLICRRLRRRLLTERATGYPGRAVFSGALLARPAGRGGEAGFDSVRIEGCHGRATVLRGRGEPRGFDRGEPENVDLGGGLLTWDTAHPGFVYQEEEIDPKATGALDHGSLSSYALASARRDRFALPRLRLYTGSTPPTSGIFGYSAHTDSAVFWLAARTLVVDKIAEVQTAAVYAARLG